MKNTVCQCVRSVKDNDMLTRLALLGLLFFSMLAPVAARAQEGMPEMPEPLFEQELEAEQPPAVRAADDPVSISVTQGRIQDVLRELAAMRPGTTIMIDPEVSGQVSFELQEVPWEMALQLVADAQGLEIVRRSENVYLVRPATILVDEDRDLVLELYTRQEIERLPEHQLLAMYGAHYELPADPDTEEIRRQMMEAPEFYVKRLSVTNRKAIEVINHLARQSNIDFVFSTHFEPAPGADPEQPAAAPSPESGPPISLNVRNRPVPVALRLIAEQGALSVFFQDGIWVVKPLRPEERILEPLITRTFNVRYIPVDEKLVADLESIKSDRGRIISRGKTLTVFETAERLEKMERIISDQDVPTPQVLIEARFFVLNDATAHELGIDWQPLTQPGDQGGGLSFGASAQPLTYDSFDKLHLGPLQATLTLPQLTTVLRALDGMDKAQQLSNPKILVSSDEQATIHIGRQVPILRSLVDTSGQLPITTYELDPNFGGEAVQVIDLLPDRPGRLPPTDTYTAYSGYLDLGTKLTVAPSVKTEDEVYIRVVPELITRPADVTLGPDNFQQTFPVLFRVRVQTQFNLRSGQTVAIGGLVSEDKADVERGIAFLGRIPLIGRLFSYKTQELVRSETIIFLTVRVVSPDQIDAISAIPVNARDVQSEIDVIRIQDSENATYSEQRAREYLRLQRSRRRPRQSIPMYEPVLEPMHEPEAPPSEPDTEPELPAIFDMD